MQEPTPTLCSFSLRGLPHAPAPGVACVTPCGRGAGGQGVQEAGEAAGSWLSVSGLRWGGWVGSRGSRGQQGVGKSSGGCCSKGQPSALTVG